MKRIAPEWYSILCQCGVKPTTAAIWSEVFAAVVIEDTFRSEDDLRSFLGQALHESGRLEQLEENLSYSAERLCAVWPKRFPTRQDASPYARNPQALANKVYGGRLGNVEPDDGYACRGSGVIQVTGLDNLTALARLMGWVDPRALAHALRTDLVTALRGSIAWWMQNIPLEIVDDLPAVTRKVNGGTAGLEDRIALTSRAEVALA